MLLARLLLPLFALALAASSRLAAGAQDVSEAERFVFMRDHLSSVKKEAVLRYHFKKSGTLESGYEDTATVRVRPSRDQRKATQVAYLSGAQRLALPDVEDAKSNPVILHFLERDTREMHRLTGGWSGYFRKRIRMAFADRAVMRAVPIKFEGRELKGTEVRIVPYVNDPVRAKFGNFEKKNYLLTFSDQIPGTVYELRSVVMDPAKPDRVLIEEVLTFERMASP